MLPCSQAYSQIFNVVCSCFSASNTETLGESACMEIRLISYNYVTTVVTLCDHSFSLVCHMTECLMLHSMTLGGKFTGYYSMSWRLIYRCSIFSNKENIQFDMAIDHDTKEDVEK